MRVAVASDHAGFALKSELIAYLKERGISVEDVGVARAERCDYPDYAVQACSRIQDGAADWGLLVCGTGVGMSMCANKLSGIRAAVVSDTFSAAGTRAHNNANVLCMGERVVGVGLAKQIVDVWIETSFEGGRHQARIDKMMKIEEKA